MGVIQTVENESGVNGAIDFSRLPQRDPVKLKLSGPRTTPFQVVIRQSALNRVHEHGDGSSAVEVCGVLVGDVYRDATSPFLQVEYVIEGEAATGSAGQVTFTADTWQHIQETMDKQFPELRIVGWYHTHPGHGIFLSEMDVFLHESFFGLPWQTALVYDPRSGEEGFFGAEGGHPQRMPHLIEADEPATATLAQAAQPTGALETAPVVAPRRVATPLMRTRKPRNGPSLGRIFLAIIGLLLFAVLGMLLGLLIRMQDLHIPDWIQRMWHP
ncbi:MAG: Mov34/MPN/PAD-1 family protein [Tepidisphaeraceae bacterium]